MSPRPRSSLRRPALAVLLLAAVLTSPAPSHRTALPEDAPWAWPVIGPVTRPFVQPATPYGPGHRGIDILSADGMVRAPAAGDVRFVGTVVDRPVISLDHGDGFVSSLEPVRTQVTAGSTVDRGQVIGVVDRGGHVREGEVHLGVRRDGEYINPLLLLGGVPRAVLLPCCED